MKALFQRMFDDASIFPPGNAPIPDAIRAHAAHRSAWHAECVGPFVCSDTRLGELAEHARGDEPLPVSVTVPGGAGAVADAVRAVRREHALCLAALEVRVDASDIGDALPALRDAPVPVYAEIPAAQVDAAVVRELGDAGLRLKLRTGGTNAAAFPTETELARALGAAVGAGLAFKCTAGLHHAARHRDPATGFEHHGFVNVILATRAALSGADPRTTLAEQDAVVLAERITELEPEEIVTIRGLFHSFGTCSIDDPITDLTSMGLVNAP